MRLILLFLIVLSINSVPALSQADLNKGLVGCYPFTGNARDLSPSQNHGKVTGATLAEDRFGNKNNAYYFDGQNDFIEIDAKILLLNTFSYSLWISPESFPEKAENFTLFSIGSQSGDQQIFLANQYTNGIVNSFSHGSYQGLNQNVVCNYPKPPEINKWYHIVLTKDEDNYYFYVNGALICTNSIKGKTAFYGTGTPRALIASRTNYHKKPRAIIDDIHLYNRSLSQQEVQALFEESLPNSKNIELTFSKPDPCAGEVIKISSNTDADVQLKWTVSPAVVQSQTANTIEISLPKKNTDYEIVIQAETVPNNTACFPEKSKLAKKTIKVKTCPSLPPIPIPDNLQLYIPSAFSPNGDGVNDDLQIINWEEFKEFEIWVYNRWGEVIFYSSGYPTPWNGKYLETSVPNGLYLYKIFSEKKEINSGTVTVLF